MRNSLTESQILSFNLRIIKKRFNIASTIRGKNVNVQFPNSFQSNVISQISLNGVRHTSKNKHFSNVPTLHFNWQIFAGHLTFLGMAELRRGEGTSVPERTRETNTFFSRLSSWTSTASHICLTGGLGWAGDVQDWRLYRVGGGAGGDTWQGRSEGRHSQWSPAWSATSGGLHTTCLNCTIKYKETDQY